MSRPHFCWNFRKRNVTKQKHGRIYIVLTDLWVARLKLIFIISWGYKLFSTMTGITYMYSVLIIILEINYSVAQGKKRSHMRTYNNSIQRLRFVVTMLYGELWLAGTKNILTFMTPPSLASATAKGSWASFTIFFRTFFSCLLILPSIRAVNAFGKKKKQKS